MDDQDQNGGPEICELPRGSLIADKVGLRAPCRTQLGWRLKSIQQGERVDEDCHCTGTLGTGSFEHLEKTLALGKSAKGEQRRCVQIKDGS